MERTGRLEIVNDVSSVGLALAIDGAPDALGAATQFVRARGFDSGDDVTVSGADGALGPREVFFLLDIRAHALAGAMGMAEGKKKRASGKKSARGKTKKVSAARKTKAAKKKTAKKKTAPKKKKK